MESNIKEKIAIGNIFMPAIYKKNKKPIPGEPK